MSTMTIVNLSPRAARGLTKALRRWHFRRPVTRLRMAVRLVVLIGSWLATPVVVTRLIGDDYGLFTDLAVLTARIAVVMLNLIAASWELLDLDDAKELRRYIAQTWPDGRPPVCYDCGYDLRGTLAATCSECGTPVPRLEAKREAVSDPSRDVTTSRTPPK